jgi:hypothetical protein
VLALHAIIGYAHTMQKESKPKRVSMALRNDLNERVFKKAKELEQNPNFFVNQIIEGVLDAMDGNETSENIPILTLNRLMKEKPLLDSRIVNDIISLFAPNHEEVTIWHRRFFARLVNKHEGKLTKEIVEFYWKQAADLNRQRIEADRELARLQKPKGGK